MTEGVVPERCVEFSTDIRRHVQLEGLFRFDVGHSRVRSIQASVVLIRITFGRRALHAEIFLTVDDVILDYSYSITVLK